MTLDDTAELLITGHSGLIGRILWRGLTDAFELYGADICLNEQTAKYFEPIFQTLSKLMLYLTESLGLLTWFTWQPIRVLMQTGNQYW